MFTRPPIPHPRYGERVFRRRIRLLADDATVVRGGLEDNLHACRLSLHHDGHAIRAIEAQWLRYPTRICPASTTHLERLVGRPLTGSRAEFRSWEDPRTHCTHLHDLLGFAVAQALRGTPSRQYDVTLPDPHEGESTLAEVALDGRVVHRWRIDHPRIAAPVELAGREVLRGFAAWSAQVWSGDELEAAAVLQMAIIVGTSQRWDLAAMRQRAPDETLSARERAANTCFAYQNVRFDSALPVVDSVRDYGDAPEELVRFVQPGSSGQTDGR